MELKKRIEEWSKNTSRWFDLSDLGLTEWPEALKGKEDLIVQLICSFNQLTSLPLLPNLADLACFHNQLTSLPLFPKLTTLMCDNNALVSLPLFPNLIGLQCHHNQLTSLPLFPKLISLSCLYNKLTSLPPFTNLTDEFWCSNNPLLFSTELAKWKKVWRLGTLRSNEIRSKGLFKVIKVLKNRLYLPRLNQLKHELIYSPNHPGKFYKNLRVGDWSFEKKKSKKKLMNK